VAAEYARTSAEAGSIATLGWREFFVAPQLQRLIETALANNRDIRIAAGRVEEARAAYRIEGSWLYPDLNASASGTRARIPGDVSGFGEPMTSTQIYAQLGASWEIDFWGRLRNLRQYARQQYLASEEAHRAVAISLVANVANTFLAHREYEERLALTAESIATREEALRILRRRYEVGSGSKLDMTQAQLLLAQAKTALHALEQQRDLNFNALALLVGQPVEIGPGKLRLAETDRDRPLPAGLPSELLIHRPDIIAAEHQLRAANADIGAARAAFFPNITLTGSAGTASSELDGLFGGGSGAWSFTPSLRLPIFNAGRLAANLDLAEARRNIAVAAYEQTVQRAFQDVSDAAQRRFARSATLAAEGAMAVQERDDDQANVEGAQAALAAARAQVLAAQAAIASARSQVIGAGSNAEAAAATVRRLDADIADSALKAPRDARVQYRVAQPGEVLGSGGRVLNLVDLSDVYMTFFLPETVVGRVAIGSEARIVLDAAPEYPIPAKISFVADVAQFTPKTVETKSERQKLMFRVKAQIDPDLLQKHISQVKTGLPGMAYVRIDPDTPWPDELAIRTAP